MKDYLMIKRKFKRKLIKLVLSFNQLKIINKSYLKKSRNSKQFDQTNAELQSIKDNNQKLLEEKIKLLETNNAERQVYDTQLLYIQKWMDCIDKLEKQIHAMIHCSESKKGSSYSQAKFCRKIGYDFDREVIVKAFDLNIKFKKECRKFLDTLLLKKLEEMKTQQREFSMKDI